MATILRLCLASVILAALAQGPNRASGAEAEDGAWPGWGADTPERQGMRADRLDSLGRGLFERGTSHLLVIRNDRVVLERYAAGQGRTRPHYTASLAKALVGG